jgi:hypothetical protein
MEQTSGTDTEGKVMHHELLAQIAVFAFAMFAGITGIGAILRKQDRDRFIARLTESSVTCVEAEQPGFKSSQVAPGIDELRQAGVDLEPGHWRAGYGAACTDPASLNLATAMTRLDLRRPPVPSIGRLVFGRRTMQVEPDIERERR